MFYKVPIKNGVFEGVNYSDIIEGIAFQRHVDSGIGYVQTSVEYHQFDAITEEEFNSERKG